MGHLLTISAFRERPKAGIHEINNMETCKWHKIEV